MNRIILSSGAFFGLLAVILGAFGAHGLKELISAEAVESFETGVRYQMYHAFLLLILGNLDSISIKTKRIIFWFIGIGLVFFSGSIYGLATNTLTTFDFKQIAYITPLGGLFLILSWGILLISFFKSKAQ